MNPGSLNLTIRNGDSYTLILTISNPNPTDPSGQTAGGSVDLSGCVAEMQIAALYGVAPLYSLSSASPTTNGGTISLGGASGTVTISIPPADTLGLANGQYDLKIKFADDSIHTLVTGSVFTEKEVTVWA